MNRDTSATIEGAVAAAGGANERELLARVAEGDSAAGRELVRRYDRLIAAAARRVLFSPADVDDVVQETFLILLVSADSIRDPDRLGPWLWTTASNLARRTARRNVRSRPVEDIEARVAPERDASDEVEWALERRRAVRGPAGGDGVDHVRGAPPDPPAHGRGAAVLRDDQRGDVTARRQPRPDPAPHPRQAPGPSGDGPRRRGRLTRQRLSRPSGSGRSGSPRSARSRSARRAPRRAWPAGAGRGRRPSAPRRSTRSPTPATAASPG